MKNIITLENMSCAGVCAFVASFLFYFLCLNHVSINEIGIAYNSRNGEIALQHPGWHVTSLLTQATTVSTLPFVVDLSRGMSGTAVQRVLNVKLVRFVPEHVKEFVEIEGFHYMQNSMPYTFAPYAFSGKTYPFLEILESSSSK